MLDKILSFLAEFISIGKTAIPAGTYLNAAIPLRKRSGIGLLGLSNLKDLPNGQEVQIGELPTGYWPQNNLTFDLRSPNGAEQKIRIRLYASNGSITALNYSATASGVLNVYGTLVYIIA